MKNISDLIGNVTIFSLASVNENVFFLKKDCRSIPFSEVSAANQLNSFGSVTNHSLASVVRLQLAVKK